MSSASPAFDPSQAEKTVFRAVLHAMHRFGAQKAILEDPESGPLTYKRLVLAALVLGRRVIQGTEPGEAVGVLLPNASGLVITLLGLNAYGRVAAQLNFTAGPKNIVSAVKTAKVRRVVTSHRFIDVAKLDDVVAALAAAEAEPGRPIEIVYLEDVRNGIGTVAKVAGVLKSLTPGLVHGRTSMKSGDAAVILFTSGTEGAPKGVVLSNANLVANATQILAHAQNMLGPADIVMNPLPMFHSFGLTAATLMPLLGGMKVVLYPSPLHYRQVPKLIADKKATVLFATDTFLQGYGRAADPDDLKSVRFVVAGAERVKDATRTMWAKTGTEILEGYGATECAPVIACNLPGPGNRHGSVGRMLPGISHRLERVEGITEGGKLLVMGPNIMAGYMLASAPGVLVPPTGGWHDTGDIVAIDDGFVTIKGRAKRFAKIGGKMISLAAVEALAAGIWPDAQHVAVSLPDPKKGEQVMLVTDMASADRMDLLAYAQDQGMPELFVPKAILVTGAIPVLGSGKVDYAATLEMARQARPLL